MTGPEHARRAADSLRRAEARGPGVQSHGLGYMAPGFHSALVGIGHALLALAAAVSSAQDGWGDVFGPEEKR